ncbi:ATPase [Paracoccus suum]|uniref:ATPase n=1 Tax=Paracoccus suum TaxID=2259340 RepID=A0A344PM41_9RHOB|nr:ATPase [Paracoccus suum]AXC50446.1 ATPase [Paracoccus suum]
MIYASGAAWREAPEKRIMLFGMSGLGKTHLAAMLRRTGDWYHYSVDYRIGTRYLGEEIADEFKREAMRLPRLRELLLSDSLRVESNITFDNLAPLSCWLGKPGGPDMGGLPIDEYRRRQDLHRAAEVAASLDAGHFIRRARDLYGYPNFVCDTSGSICEVIDAADPGDPVLNALAGMMLPVWIEGSPEHTSALIERFNRAPKPMYYRPEFLTEAWQAYGLAHPGPVDPDAFIRWTYARALAARQPRYAAMARRGVSVTAAEVGALTGPDDFNDLIALAIDRTAAARGTHQTEVS